MPQTSIKLMQKLIFNQAQTLLDEKNIANVTKQIPIESEEFIVDQYEGSKSIMISRILNENNNNSVPITLPMVVYLNDKKGFSISDIGFTEQYIQMSLCKKGLTMRREEIEDIYNEVVNLSLQSLSIINLHPELVDKKTALKTKSDIPNIMRCKQGLSLNLEFPKINELESKIQAISNAMYACIFLVLNNINEPKTTEITAYNGA